MSEMFEVVAEGHATIDDKGDVTLTLKPVDDDCVHCFDDGTPVYPHDEHETLAAYRARQEADLIREALAIAKERDR